MTPWFHRLPPELVSDARLLPSKTGSKLVYDFPTWQIASLFAKSCAKNFSGVSLQSQTPLQQPAPRYWVVNLPVRTRGLIEDYS